MRSTIEVGEQGRFIIRAVENSTVIGGKVIAIDDHGIRILKTRSNPYKNDQEYVIPWGALTYFAIGPTDLPSPV